METRTNIGTHLATARVADALHISAGGGGVIVGFDAGTEEPVVVRLLQGEPRSYVALGRLPFLQLIAFRVSAVGARVMVQTKRPAAWEAFIRLAAGMSAQIGCAGFADAPPPGSAIAPVLVIRDADSTVELADLRPRPWMAVMEAYDGVSQWNVRSLVEADLVLAQDLPIAQARLVGARLSMDEPEAVLSGLTDDGFTIFNRSSSRACSRRLTAQEGWLLRNAHDPAATEPPDRGF